MTTESAVEKTDENPTALDPKKAAIAAAIARAKAKKAAAEAGQRNRITQEKIMFKKMVSSPHTHSGKLTARIMLWVIAAMLPALLTQIYYFGMGVLVQSALAISFALLLEFIVTKLRNKPNLVYISDFSVVLTALILAMAIPPYAPYWVILIGTLSAVILGKHVYGGLGQNPFNPAMVGYVVLLISFPLQMTSWMPPISLLNEPPTFAGFSFFNFHRLNH